MSCACRRAAARPACALARRHGALQAMETTIRTECREQRCRRPGPSRAAVRAPQGALGLFAAGRRAAHRRPRQAGGRATRLPALGLTDTNNLFGALEFSDKLAARRHAADRRLRPADRFRRQPRGRPGPLGPADAGAQPARRAGAAGRNEAGYANLMRLAARAFFDPADGRAAARQDRRGSTPRSAGLIALTGGPTARSTARCARTRSRWRAERARAARRRFSATGSTSSCSATA